MAKAAELIVKGIKCDNPKCDFADMSVKFEDYKDWLNKPCPKCGSNLLTQKDYDNTKILMKITGAISNLFGDIPDDTPKSRIKINMDGTGKVEFENPESGDKLIVKHGNSGSDSGEK